MDKQRYFYIAHVGYLLVKYFFSLSSPCFCCTLHKIPNVYIFLLNCQFFGGFLSTLCLLSLSPSLTKLLRVFAVFAFLCFCFALVSLLFVCVSLWFSLLYPFICLRGSNFASHTKSFSFFCQFVAFC